MALDPIKTLTSYVPALVVRRIAADPRPITGPTAERFGAAVLFADIRGFTAIADRLSRQGQVGAEQLAELLNDCFGQLIEIVYEHGGEVTKFAGDALLALWPVSQDVTRLGPEAREALAQMVIRSAQCGLAIQETLDIFEASSGSQLRLQVGIGAGDVYSVHLGGVLNRWEFLLSGAPLAQMSQAKEAARPGKVVLSPEAWSLIKSECGGTILSEGFVELGSTPNVLPVEPLDVPVPSLEAKPSLQSYIPAAVLARLEAGHNEWLSEIRRVVVLFIKLPQYGTSIRHPYERTIPEAQAVMEALQGALYRYAGSINKLNVDDKGITLVAALGLPPLSHRNDASRAVHAALEMQSALTKLQRKSTIGITMGWVFCGPVGSDQRREYTMVGNAVNMAARLMQAAEESAAEEPATSGQDLADMLCDEAVFRAIHRLAEEGDALAEGLTFRTLPSIHVKGLPDPVTAYRPSFRQSSRSHWRVQRRRDIALVGKDEAQRVIDARLRSLARASKEANGGLIVVEGEAGSGKSLLLDELYDAAQQNGLRVLKGSGSGLAQDTPYHAWKPIFQQLFDVDPFLSDRHARRSQILRQLPPIRGERGFPAFAIRMAPLLNAVLPLDLPENRTTRRMARGVRHKTTQQFLLRLLQRQVLGTSRKKARPTVLLLDSGQWMDPYSWELAISISREVSLLLTIIATRPLSEQVTAEEMMRIGRRIASEDRISRLTLGALSKPELADLLWHEAGVQAIPEEVLDVLFYNAGGRPTFSLALIRQWSETGLVEIDGGVVRVVDTTAALRQTQPPEEVRQLVTGRIERFSPVQQLILKVASVIGERFDLRMLLQLYPVDRDSDILLPQIQELASSDFLVPAPDTSEPGYRFSCRFYWQVANSLLPLAQRQKLENELRFLKEGNNNGSD